METAASAAGGEGEASENVFGSREATAVVYGALGQVEEHPVYDLPKEWKTLVSTLCLRTNFEPAELADLFQRFRQLAGERMGGTGGAPARGKQRERERGGEEGAGSSREIHCGTVFFRGNSSD